MSREDDGWRELAACRGLGPDLFFPGRQDNEASRAARAVCGGCVVRHRCLVYSTTVPENGRPPSGIWGGLNSAERTGIRRRLSGAA